MAYLLVSEENNPYINVAREEYLYSQKKDWDEVYMLWINAPSVFMGKYQCVEAETDISLLKSSGIPIIRRISGGGTVYHDYGNLNLSIIKNEKRIGEGFDMKFFTQPVEQLVKTLTHINLVRSERGDLRYNNKKIAGSAQALKSGRMLYHLSILFDANLNFLDKILQGNQSIASRVASVKSKVMNLKELMPSVNNINAFRDLLISELYNISPNMRIIRTEDLEERYIEKKIKETFANDSWTYSSIGRKK